MRLPICLLVGMTCAGLVPAQRLSLLTEFQRVNTDGQVVTADRAERRREVISPAVIRNAYATFHVVVEMPPGVPYTLFVAQNPEGTVDARLYQEVYTRSAGDWVPDELKKVDLPHTATLGPGQKAQTYLLDARVPPDTPTGRFRLEVQLNANGRWVIYPLEVRVQGAVAQDSRPLPAVLPEPGARADRAALASARVVLCGHKSAPAPAVLSNLRQVVARNAARDLTLARGKEELAEMVPRAAGFKSVEALCRANSAAPAGPEWWLRLRDYFYQGKRIP